MFGGCLEGFGGGVGGGLEGGLDGVLGILSHLRAILGPSCARRGARGRFKDPKSCICKNLKKQLVFLGFWGPGASQERLQRPMKAPKRHPKSSKTSKTRDPKMNPKNINFLINFVAILGAILGPELAPKLVKKCFCLGARFWTRFY